MRNHGDGETEAVIVGGGLAGLAAAALLARKGVQVTLLEKSERPGGRARTHVQDGYHFNLGPHALYAAGAGMPVLKELGIPVRGRRPSVRGYAVRGGRWHTLPVGPASLLATGLLTIADKLEAGRLLARIPRLELRGLEGVSLAEWLDGQRLRPGVRELASTLTRVTTYAHDPEQMSAAAALGQLQLGTRGVLYLDGGWQGLVDGLEQAARAAGARLETRAGAAAVEPAASRLHVRLAHGGTLAASAVILAGAPDTAARLLWGRAAEAVAAWRRASPPVRAACLDVGLRRLPRPEAAFALGVDRPLYASVHSATARLAPAGGALVHVARYLGPERPEPRDVEAELEGLLDRLQPGWRAEAAHRRFLPEMVVAHALPTARAGGLPGRPGPELADAPGVFLAGDWVGAEGQLADASLASASGAARQVLGRLRRGAAA